MILIYAEEITPRIEYIFKLVFNQILSFDVVFTTNSSKFQKSELPKINYSVEKFGDEFYIKPHRITQCKALLTPSINSVWYEGKKYFCESSEDSTLPFDPFAASFYVVTRHEEYTEENLDKLDRYPVQKSILSKYNLLHKPIVNIWANLVADKLKEIYPDLKFRSQKFEFISTIDVDNAYAYQNKGFWRTSAAWARALLKGEMEEHKKRKRVFSGKERDPYDTYDYLDTVFQGNEDKVKFFFLMGNYGQKDKNVSHTNEAYQKLIKRTANKYDVGLHPSFATSQKGGKKKVRIEKKRLEEIAGKEITKSRQHYLMLRFPRTYTRLIKAGIQEDYTLGYSPKTGFRGGICTPYYYYDLKHETTTNLLIVPFQVMDGTLLHYMQLNPDQAFEEIKTLMQEVKNVGGTFVSVWHNETVNNIGQWEGYREVFEKMNKLGFEWANKA
ncbi:polysaccharide deacetylase family protein [Prolixibacteraceae bacterium Z1-6]|uniref:Polysaccharide deacetylase family protein n=1 Tax=Draconibacterium aestuarii TaxID=2998507 RepID=A0A9X3F971_9BACT|nr:polysaccharide deacetylase family protein [Prolixibacteraceae bacterium Z1-6]